MTESISIPVAKVDNHEKLDGSALYLGDLKPEGMLYAKTLRSDRARARIVTIDIPSLPEGYFIVDRHDIPGKNRVKVIIEDQPVFAEDQVNYIGEPILLVVGHDKTD
ncbi:MAG TPA: aldehyde oxidase, partial [Bacillota bacterium]|nr:aldehyde oxidase [Bacillota bacterium]